MKKSDQTRQFIIEKAAALFNQKGYAGTCMRDIMEATNLSKGAIYGNFKKGGADKKGVKQEIALAAFEYSVDMINNTVGQRTRIIESAIDKLKTVVYFYKERVLNPPIEGGCPILNTSIEADDNHPELQKKVRKAIKYWESRIIYTIEKGIESKEINADVDPTEFAILFISCLEGGIMMARIKRSTIPFNIMARQLLQKIDELKK